MSIVLAGPEPEVVVGMSGHVPTLRRALRSLNVSDTPTNLKSMTANASIRGIFGNIHALSEARYINERVDR